MTFRETTLEHFGHILLFGYTQNVFLFFLTASHFFPWRGQLQIGTHFLDVGLRSTEGALIPVELYVKPGSQNYKQNSHVFYHLHHVNCSLCCVLI